MHVVDLQRCLCGGFLHHPVGDTCPAAFRGIVRWGVAGRGGIRPAAGEHIATHGTGHSTAQGTVNSIGHGGARQRSVRPLDRPLT